MLLQDGTRTYVYGDRLLYTVDGTGPSQAGTATWPLSDKIGSTAQLINAAGVVTGSYTYDVFGAVKTQTGAATEFSFTGEQNDPNGLEFLRARYYDPSTGRFLSRDPLGDAYRYAANNPISKGDPSGKSYTDNPGALGPDDFVNGTPWEVPVTVNGVDQMAQVTQTFNLGYFHLEYSVTIQNPALPDGSANVTLAAEVKGSGGPRNVPGFLQPLVQVAGFVLTGGHSLGPGDLVVDVRFTANFHDNQPLSATVTWSFWGGWTLDAPITFDFGTGSDATGIRMGLNAHTPFFDTRAVISATLSPLHTPVVSGASYALTFGSVAWWTMGWQTCKSSFC